MLLYVYIYFFWHFLLLLFFIKKFVLLLLFSFFLWSVKFPQQNINQSEKLVMKNGDEKLSVELQGNTLNTVDHLMRYVIVHVLTSTKTSKRCSFVKCIPLLTYPPYVTNYSKTSINAINKIMNLCNSVLCKLYFLSVLSI